VGNSILQPGMMGFLGFLLFALQDLDWESFVGGELEVNMSLLIGFQFESLSNQLAQNFQDEGGHE
jgi:hypothetical protein